MNHEDTKARRKEDERAEGMVNAEGSMTLAGAMGEAVDGSRESAPVRPGTGDELAMLPEKSRAARGGESRGGAGGKAKALATGEKKPKRTGVVRLDSLWGALQTEERRQKLCDWLFAEGDSHGKCVTRLWNEFELHTTTRAVKFFYNQYAFAWRVEMAKDQAEIERGRLPTDWDASVREALAQRRFVAVYNNLSDKQIIAFEKLDLDRRKLDLQASQVLLSERRLILLEKKMAEAKEALEDPTIDAEEQARRLKKILGR